MNDAMVCLFEQMNKVVLEDRCVRLLMLRAGGYDKRFEAGMLYQCLLLLGMKEYGNRRQVESLEKIVCHYRNETDAMKKLEKLLKEEKAHE